MKVEILLSKNELIGSKLICWGTGKLYPNLDSELVPSHLAILVDGFVYESTLFSGVRIVPFDSWLEINTILYRQSRDIEIDRYSFSKIFSSIWGKGYDWYGICYYSICLIRFMLFNIPMPKTNKWAKSSKYFCTEVLGRMLKKDYSMVVPVDMAVIGF
jgi:hypothetical protein